MFFSHHFRTFSKNWSIFSKLFRSSWQNCILPDHRINLRTYICFDKVFVCFFNDLWKLNGEITVFFVEKQSEALSILLTTYPRGYFAENFLRKSSFFFIIGHWATFSCHFYGNLSVPFPVLFSACQMDQCVVKKLLSKYFFPIIFGHWSQNDQSLFELFPAKLTTLQSTGPRNQFEDLSPFWQTFVCFMYPLRTLSQKIKAFFRKTIDRVVKIAHHVSKGIFCWEFFFRKSSFSISALGIERIFSVISTESCRSRCQYCFLFVNKTSLWWTKFRSKIFFHIIFGQSSKNY